jgi:hypothetical protein
VHRFIPIALFVGAAVSACDGSSGSGTESREAPWWLLILVVSGLIVILGSIVRRGSRKNRAMDPTSWKADARSGFAHAHWLYDAMSEDLAVWRGNAMFEPQNDTVSAKSANDRWHEFERRYGEASDSLYRLEVGAPDNRSAASAHTLIAAMSRTKKAFDARADARLTYRRIAADGGEGQVLTEARDREVRASITLSETRVRFSDALADLSIFA